MTRISKQIVGQRVNLPIIHLTLLNFRANAAERPAWRCIRWPYKLQRVQPKATCISDCTKKTPEPPVARQTPCPRFTYLH